MSRQVIVLAYLYIGLSIACSSKSGAVAPAPAAATSPALVLATSTPVPLPTTTPVPLPTAIPSPTPYTPLVTAWATPSRVKQGGVAVVWAESAPGASVSGSFEGRSLIWVQSLDQPGRYWALIGFSPDSRLGPRPIAVSVRGGGGATADTQVSIEVTAGEFLVERITVPADRTGLLAPALLNDEKARLESLTSVARRERLWSGIFVPPAQGVIASSYGASRSFNEGPSTGHHLGTDFDADTGAPVAAANDGVVVVADTWQVRGQVALIDHGLGVFSGYYHLSEVLVKSGQRVSKGQVIGRVGDSGLATGPHLHWDMIVMGVNVSPLEWTEREIP